MAKNKQTTRKMANLRKKIGVAKRSAKRTNNIRRPVARNRTNNAPAAYSGGNKVGRSILRVNKKVIGNRITVSGHEQLGAITIGAGTVPGTTVYSFSISPQSFLEQRLSIYSTLYEKYKFKSFVVKYTPQVGTDTAGQLIHWFEYDPDDDSLTGTAAVNRALSSFQPVNDVVWKPQNGIKLNASMAAKEYFTTPGSEDRLVTQAVYNVTSNSTYSTTNGFSGTVGTVEVSYVVEFFGNEINNNSNVLVRTAAAVLKPALFIFPAGVWNGGPEQNHYVLLRTVTANMHVLMKYIGGGTENFVQVQATVPQSGFYKLGFTFTYNLNSGSNHITDFDGVSAADLGDFSLYDQNFQIQSSSLSPANDQITYWCNFYCSSVTDATGRPGGLLSFNFLLANTSSVAANSIQVNDVNYFRLADTRNQFTGNGKEPIEQEDNKVQTLTNQVEELTQKLNQLMKNLEKPPAEPDYGANWSSTTPSPLTTPRRVKSPGLGLGYKVCD